MDERDKLIIFFAFSFVKSNKLQNNTAYSSYYKSKENNYYHFFSQLIHFRTCLKFSL